MPSYVITGASRGLGAEWIRQLVLEPSNQVFAIIRSFQHSTSTIASLVESNSNLHIFEADILEPEKLKRVAKEIEQITPDGRLDVLIANAGITSGKRPKDFENDPNGLEEDINLTYQTNVTGSLHTFFAFLPLLRKSPNSKAIFISTFLSFIPFIMSADFSQSFAYGASKHALNFVIAKLAIQYPEIVSLALSPGFVWTKDYLFEDAPEDEKTVYHFALNEFRKVEPEGNWIGREESISSMKKVIDGLTKEDSGMFLSHRGNVEKWL